MREYEAMFLLDNTAATEDWEATAAQVDQILAKHGAEIVHQEKWDERKLAYEIKGQRRATYYLVYFRSEPPSIREIGQDVRLNETILRHLVVALEEPIDVHRERERVERERLAEDSRRSALSGWGDRRRGDRPAREKPPAERRREGGDAGSPPPPASEAKPDESQGEGASAAQTAEGSA